MQTITIIIFLVSIADFLDPVLKAYYWVVAGTAVPIGTILLVRCAWRAEKWLRAIAIAMEKRAASFS